MMAVNLIIRNRSLMTRNSGFQRVRYWNSCGQMLLVGIMIASVMFTIC